MTCFASMARHHRRNAVVQLTVNSKRMYASGDLRFVAGSKSELAKKIRLPDGARCATSGCERMRGYYLNDCYEHAGPDPYASEGES